MNALFQQRRCRHITLISKLNRAQIPRLMFGGGSACRGNFQRCHDDANDVMRRDLFGTSSYVQCTNRFAVIDLGRHNMHFAYAIVLHFTRMLAEFVSQFVAQFHAVHGARALRVSSFALIAFAYASHCIFIAQRCKLHERRMTAGNSKNIFVV